MAKASLPDVRKAEADQWRADIGKAVERAIRECGWNLDEFAQQVQKDARQCARWIAGTERAQFDALFAVKALRKPLVVAIAELAGDGVEVVTEIRVKRSA